MCKIRFNLTKSNIKELFGSEWPVQYSTSFFRKKKKEIYATHKLKAAD